MVRAPTSVLLDRPTELGEGSQHDPVEQASVLEIVKERGHAFGKLAKEGRVIVFLAGMVVVGSNIPATTGVCIEDPHAHIGLDQLGYDPQVGPKGGVGVLAPPTGTDDLLDRVGMGVRRLRSASDLLEQG